MSETRGRTRRQRVEEKERAIVTAARAAFQEHGFDKAKIAEIARAAGVAEGTVYLYFENKNALLLAVATEFYDRLTEDAAVGIRDLAGTEDKLRFLAQHHFERVAEEWPILGLAMMPAKVSEDYRDSTAYQLNRTYVAVFDQVIRDGIHRGEIRDDVPLSMIRDIFYGGLEYAARTMRLRPAEEEDHTEPFMRMILDGLMTGVRPLAPASETVVRRLEAVASRLEEAAK